MRLDQDAIEAFRLPDTFIPCHLRGPLQAHIERGAPVGSFLDAVLINDLKAAVFSADPITLRHLPTIVRWLWNFAPLQCHGNENHVRGWIDARQNDLRKERGRI